MGLGILNIEVLCLNLSVLDVIIVWPNLGSLDICTLAGPTDHQLTMMISTMDAEFSMNNSDVDLVYSNCDCEAVDNQGLCKVDVKHCHMISLPGN